MGKHQHKVFWRKHPLHAFAAAGSHPGRAPGTARLAPKWWSAADTSAGLKPGRGISTPATPCLQPRLLPRALLSVELWGLITGSRRQYWGKGKFPPARLCVSTSPALVQSECSKCWVSQALSLTIFLPEVDNLICSQMCDNN